MDRQKVAKEAIANFDKVHPNSSLEAKNFYIAEWLDGLEGFASLVKRMREAQKVERKWGIVNFKTEEDKVACGEAIRRMYQLEQKVDEHIKKMEE
jgi:hypothetical protein